MGRDRKKITFYVTESQRREIKGLCAHLGISMSFFIDLSIRDRIKKEINKVKPKDAPCQKE